MKLASTANQPAAPSAAPEKHSGWLGICVLSGVAGGLLLGLAFRHGLFNGGADSAAQALGDAGMLIIQLLKTVAIPLILFGILDAILRTDISWRSGRKLIGICLVNVSVAFVIGLTLMNTVRPGHQVQGRVRDILTQLTVASPHVQATPSAFKKAAQWIPPTPNVCLIALLGIAGGALLRSLRVGQLPAGPRFLDKIQLAVASTYEALMRMIQGVIRLVPFAVFGLVAHLVNRSGLEPFKVLWVFLVVVLLGMGIHALIYYPFAAWLRTGMSPRKYFRGGADAIITGLSTNSSLATVPVTLECLTGKLGISEKSARLAACMGTNLNNDGITLYEAMAALFLAQACGFDLGLGQQATVVLAALVAGVGVAGVPEAGLMVLPVVLGAAGLPEATIAAAVPLLASVDWLLARARSGVNVMSDMTVAVLLDGQRSPALVLPSVTTESADAAFREVVVGEGFEPS